MVTGEKVGGKRVFSLTDAGREYAETLPDQAPWDEMTASDRPDAAPARGVQGVMAATWQVGRTGSPSRSRRRRHPRRRASASTSSWPATSSARRHTRRVISAESLLMRVCRPLRPARLAERTRLGPAPRSRERPRRSDEALAATRPILAHSLLLRPRHRQLHLVGGLPAAHRHGRLELTHALRSATSASRCASARSPSAWAA